MNRKAGLESLMKTKGELRELAGRVLLGDYMSECESVHPSGENFTAGVKGQAESLEMLALTFCRPGLTWLLGQLEDVFGKFPDRSEVMKRLADKAAGINCSCLIPERSLMLGVIDEAECIIDEKMAGRLGRILNSVKGLSTKVKEK
jgi:hypothetical protein